MKNNPKCFFLSLLLREVPLLDKEETRGTKKMRCVWIEESMSFGRWVFVLEKLRKVWMKQNDKSSFGKQANYGSGWADLAGDLKASSCQFPLHWGRRCSRRGRIKELLLEGGWQRCGDLESWPWIDVWHCLPPTACLALLHKNGRRSSTNVFGVLWWHLFV